jgi:hypothetical protein
MLKVEGLETFPYPNPIKSARAVVFARANPAPQSCWVPVAGCENSPVIRIRAPCPERYLTYFFALRMHEEAPPAPFDVHLKRPPVAVTVAFDPRTLLVVTRVLIPYTKSIWARGYGWATETSLKAVRGSLIQTFRDWLPFVPTTSVVGFVP